MKQIIGIVESTAIAYFLSYKCLIDKHIEVCDFFSDSYSVYFVPAITTAAFSCELALKNISQTESGKIPRGHDLYKLFYQLNESNRKDIMDRSIHVYNLKSEILSVSYRISEIEFNDLLYSHKDTFVIWRYFYERLSSLDLDFIEAFMFSLNCVEDEYSDYVLSQIALRNIKNKKNGTE
jgi:HEPN domain-containing protein